MLLELFLALMLGILAGTFTGLTPGIHINLVGAMLVSLTSSGSFFIAIPYLIVFVVAMATTHTFVDFIPSILLGCPDTDTELSVLPGHELLKKGEGYLAIMLTAYGGIAAIILTAILFFPVILLFENLHGLIKDYIGYLLILISFILIILEKEKLKALGVFMLTGTLGYLILNSNINEPLLPLLSGLFGSSLIILSLKNKTKIPKQKITSERIKIAKPILGSLIASPLCSFLPGLGGGQAAVIGNQISRVDKKEFLVLVGATNTFVMSFSFLALYAIAKARSGAAATINEITGSLSTGELMLIIFGIVLSGISAFFITKSLSKIFISKIEKVDYGKISIGTLIFLTLIIFFISGFIGIFAFIISTAVGIYCASLKLRRTLMMGCLMIPTIILYLL